MTSMGRAIENDSFAIIDAEVGEHNFSRSGMGCRSVA